MYGQFIYCTHITAEFLHMISLVFAGATLRSPGVNYVAHIFPVASANEHHMCRSRPSLGCICRSWRYRRNYAVGKLCERMPLWSKKYIHV